MHQIADALRMAVFMFWETLWALVLGFGLSGVVQAFVSRERMQRTLGDHGPVAVARASGLGMVSSSCSYAATAMARSLFDKGADFISAMVFMFASTNLVLELGIVLIVLIGWQFAAAEFAGGAIMIVLLALVGGVFIGTPRRQQQGEHETHDMKASWADAASYTIADLTMLRRELVIGYGVAGLIAVFVPATLWHAIFFEGHGFVTTLENAIIGPFIAVVSFVCSIGNVPLAAALWHGGLGFGGVIAFIFADLITFPLLLIYRKYYGTKLALRLLATFWLVMSAAGLVVDVVFDKTGILPHRGAMTAAMEPHFAWNYTTFLNIAALVVFAVLYRLYRTRGQKEGFAIDPVCGMQVRTADAPASTIHNGEHVYFCSDHCRERFAKREPAPATTVKDPVCGMDVDPATAVRRGDQYFCCEGCADAYERDVAR